MHIKIHKTKIDKYNIWRQGQLSNWLIEGSDTKDIAKIPNETFVMNYLHELGSSQFWTKNILILLPSAEISRISMIQGLQKIGTVSKAPNYALSKLLDYVIWYLY